MSRPPFPRRRLRRGSAAGILVAALAGAAHWWLRAPAGTGAPPPVAAPPPGRTTAGPGGPDSAPAAPGSIEDAWERRASDVAVEVTAPVEKLLKDDTEGLPHQRFLLRLPSGHTVLVAHNIQLAPRVPLGVGDEVTVRGEFEWNPKGGVIHWTHKDPRGKHPGGWIRAAGRLYQ